jgi:outer membrane lipoprotein LolB
VIRALLAAACMAGAVGCATPPASDDGTAWTAGRLSLRVDAAPGRPAQNLSAAFELRGSGSQGELRLMSPLGTLLVAARWQPGAVTLNSPEGEQRFASLDELSRQALGEAVPLAALPDWLAGRPWPQAAHEVQPDGFAQLGWQVQTQRLAEGWISARRDAAPAAQLRVRLDRGEP